MALTLYEIILAIANVIFIIVAIILFIRLRKLGKKSEPEKAQKSGQGEITNIAAHVELKPEPEIKLSGLTSPEKPSMTLSDIAPQPKIEAHEISGLKLEEELPEVLEKPVKKESKKRKLGKKIIEEAVEKAIQEETGAPSNPTMPEKVEFKFEEAIPEAVEKPVKKGGKKKKPSEKEAEEAVEIKEKTEAPPGKLSIPEKVEFKFDEPEPEKEETKPVRKEGKKKKPAKKEPRKSLL